MKRGFALIVISVALIAAGCAGPSGSNVAVPPPKSEPTPGNLVPDDYSGRFQVVASVLENADHGPQLCTMMMDSYPPQCGGPDVAGWSWSGVPFQEAVKTKWGSYLLVGTFDGKTFTLTQPPQTPGTPTPTPADRSEYATPCDAPPGGWQPVDAGLTTDDTFNAAIIKANADPDFAGLWIDRPATLPAGSNDPLRIILNVRYTKDLAKHEAELRKIWGGSLCLSPAQHTQAQLTKIQDELIKEMSVSSTSADSVNGRVDVEVYVAKASTQRDLDTRYGAGLVVLHGLLQPID
jgi:hypothetical protein